MAFERDKTEVIEDFATIATAREQRLTVATADLVAELVDYATR